jgi:hypothetical protein
VVIRLACIADGGARVALVAGSGWWWAKAEGRGERESDI